MAHFAKMNENLEVLEILVVDDADILDEGGNESESLGVSFLKELTGHSSWIQTSITGSMRKNYANIGGSYDETREAFITSQPFPSWELNEETCLWEAPVSYPDDDKLYYWDEETTTWVLS
jgi:hypothetical protein